jgi:hypothetical protein
MIGGLSAGWNARRMDAATVIVFQARTWFVIALGWLSALATGCALPNRLGLANLELDPLETLTREDAEGPPSSYPTSLNNPNRPQVLRPVVPAAPSIAQVPPTIQLPVAQALPLQQAGQPTAMALNPQELAGRLPVRMEDKPREEARANSPPNGDAGQALKSAESPPRLEQAPIVLTPASGDVASLLAAKEFTWPAVAASKSLPAVAPPVAPPPVTLPTAALSSVETPAQPVPAPEVKEPETTETAETLLPKLIAAIEKEIRERTERKEESDLPALEQKLRLLQLVADRSDDAVEKIDQLPPAEREAFKQLMFALSTWLSPDEAKRSSLRNAKVLRSLQEVDNQLATVSKLDLKNLLFCEKVESFGWYTEFSRAEFAPKQQVILYVEVQNFAAEAKTASSFETELQGSYQIFDSAGSIVDERQLPLDREICRNYRRDYFLAYRIYLPGELAAGRYRLELTIEDLKAKKEFKGRKQGEAMIEFTIK